MPQYSDDLFLGGAVLNLGTSDNGPSTMSKGLGPLGRVYVWDAVPLTLNAGALASGAASGVGNITLTAGTGVTTSVDSAGTTRYVFDVPRTVSFSSSASGDTTQTITVSGYDQYGQAMTSSVAASGTNTVATLKAFKSVTSVARSAATSGTVNVGTTDTLGLPFKLNTKDYIVNSTYNQTVVALSAYTVADATDPATAATGDVRGTVTLPSVADGVKRIVALLAMRGDQCGPNATQTAAFGVTQA